ncbi:MAG: YcxB family protein [Oscillospiraceae bacterium]|nr:YcxB family protein [Oscillospiraceae bacterium]
MNSQSVTVNVVVDAKIFHRFTVFDNLVRKRGLLLPAGFAVGMSALAWVFFAPLDQRVLGSMVLFIGLVIPVSQVWGFFRSIKMQIKAYDLEHPKTVYSLCFAQEPNGIEVTNHGGGDEPLRYEWDNLYGVYRVDGCVYLYVLPNKAFLLPDGQALEGTDALWEMLTKMLPPEKLHDRRKKR